MFGRWEPFPARFAVPFIARMYKFVTRNTLDIFHCVTGTISNGLTIGVYVPDSRDSFIAIKVEYFGYKRENVEVHHRWNVL